MKILRMIGYCFGLGLWRKDKLRELRLVRSARDRERANLLEKRRLEWMEIPEREMSTDEVRLLPMRNAIDVETCSLGTWCILPSPKGLPEIKLIGHVVCQNDFEDRQWGWTASNLPERGVNKYRLKVVVE